MKKVFRHAIWIPKITETKVKINTKITLILNIKERDWFSKEMASVFLYHVVGDLTVGKPELVEFAETETVEAAIRAIGESTEGGIAVWKKRSQKNVIENAEMRQQRFVGILNSLDIVAFLAKDECLADQDKAMKTPVAEVVVPNNSLLKEVDPATRLAVMILTHIYVYTYVYTHIYIFHVALLILWLSYLAFFIF